MMCLNFQFLNKQRWDKIVNEAFSKEAIDHRFSEHYQEKKKRLIDDVMESYSEIESAKNSTFKKSNIE